MVMHITIGGTYTNQPSEKELFIEAQRYVNNDSLTNKLLK